ncbi:AMIN-like domain-containing (lipo)protein [Vallicoccus soli]|uniref:AMIN-like domain-containing protein n=1 Tax=Vallicoccus soli TaxID=2339232 RepID=A0A3A3ZL77_9ACTN|nr:hypothetical protein [Vallicoccus soli]RJK96862.1 hypothetical protein D5H78_06270 [Vallicoccus soli]
MGVRGLAGRTGRGARRATAALGVAALLGGGAVAAAPVAGAAGCATPWGSLAERAPATTTGTVRGLRAGQHPCFDRLVVDVRGRVTGYAVRYVDQVRADGSGQVVPLRGRARLEVVVQAAGYDGQGRPTYAPARPSEAVGVGGYATFRQVAWVGSFEGQSQVGLGVRARLPFRVLVLPPVSGTSRLVVDVAHSW